MIRNNTFRCQFFMLPKRQKYDFWKYEENNFDKENNVFYTLRFVQNNIIYFYMFWA